ncbi:Peroxisomal membrane signal receptor PTS1 [Knufia obscura]|uniref:Peroxisomal membrane signal receptor PTS1 n=1 Tax=Knufia obscura TaxID=1635080 RepID=A0ABR0RIY1_9EURO|nr:Peroxisomal membrane signal receptor PTS1 [Knufia obscura]
MSFLGGAECSTAGNPLTQFTKHVQGDNTLQRDRMVGNAPGQLGETMRSRVAPNGSDQMMNDFQQAGPVPQPFAMEQMRQDLPQVHGMQQRTPSPGWANEFNPGEQSRMEAAFASSKMAQARPNGFSASDFSRFQQSQPASARAASPMQQQTPQSMNSMYRPMGMNNYGGGMGMYGGGMYGGGMQMNQPPLQESAKGKDRMVELDDKNWEEQFAELDKQTNVSEEARDAMEQELNEMDRSVPSHSDHFAEFERVWNGIKSDQAPRQMTQDFDENLFSSEDYAAWDNFDSNMGLNTHNPFEREPMLGNYMFEENNPFTQEQDPSRSAFDKGMEIIRSHGNLSLAALAFEAAVQQDPNHIEAWVQLGNVQAQNEKEAPAIRALERALELDPSNLDALMCLAVSYTNEGYDSTAYRTLERWLSVKYPSVCPPDQLSSPADVGFSDQIILHDKVTNLFIKAAQLSPSGELMDPDVQVGLGVLFYGQEDFEKAIDCFNSALQSHEGGTVNQEGQIHLLWNRLGATLANSGKSEEAIAAYSRALEENPNFVRARYNLGVSCINIGCYPEAAGHLLGALSLHRAAGAQGMSQARDILDDGHGNPIGDAELERMIYQNESNNIYDTLRRAFSGMSRRDLTERVGLGMNLDQFRGEFDF